MRKILVVDDEPDIVESLGDLLHDALGRDVLTARSAREARSLLAREPVGLVITDFRMPDEDGCQLLEDVQRRYPGVRGMLVTAFPNPAAEQQACRKVHVPLLRKPLDPDHFVRQVEALLREGPDP